MKSQKKNNNVNPDNVDDINKLDIKLPKNFKVADRKITQGHNNSTKPDNEPSPRKLNIKLPKQMRKKKTTKKKVAANRAAKKKAKSKAKRSKIPQKTPAKNNMYANAKTWNPFKGCLFDCSYCETSFKAQAKRQKHICQQCYDYVPHFHPSRLSKIPSSKIIFVAGNGDLAFASNNEILQIINAVNVHNSNHGDRKYYFQSKQPEIFKQHLHMLNENCIILTTLETNRDAGYGNISKAPVPSERYKQFVDLDYPRKVLTLEPLLDFDADEFADMIIKASPEYVWLGLNSKKKPILPEPSPAKVKQLAGIIKSNGIPIKEKDLRGL